MPRRKNVGDLESVDLVYGEVSDDLFWEHTTDALVTKGFCVVEGAVNAALQKQVLEDVDTLREEQRFYQPASEIAEGLLGVEGSARIAELPKFEDESALNEVGDGLKEVDAMMMDYGAMLNQWTDVLGFSASHRSTGFVHEAGLPETSPLLNEQDVSKWLDKFLRHKVMIILFLGPVQGVLRLQVYANEDAEIHEVLTKPGMLVLLRPDLLSHSHVAIGKAIAVTSFLIDGHAYQKRHPTGGWIVCPPAVALDQWAMNRIKELKSEVRDDADWDPAMPREWQRAMNLYYFQGHMTAILGLSGRFPTAWSAEHWFRSQVAGPDTVIEVPQVRWNHDYAYDESPDGWKQGRTWCKHGGFMDGVDLFDNKLFGISINESRGMDPNQRHLLECAYDSLYNMGKTKKSLMGSLGSVYAGLQSFEFAFVEVPPECQGCGPTGGAGCVAANRISFILGLKGPSMAVDTDTASSMSALYLTAESVQQKGRGTAAEFGVGLGCALMLSPMWWHAHCAQGWMTSKGRCLTFDVGASGYVRAEACVAAAMKPYAEQVDGELVVDDKKEPLALLSGICMNYNGRGAGLSAPNGEAEQELTSDTCRNAGISPLDVDMCEAHGYGSYLGDVIEVNSLMRVHRSDESHFPLEVTSVKTACGNTMESGGIVSLVKVIYGAAYGFISAGLHLREVNPLMDMGEDAPIALPQESLDFWRRQNFSGVLSKGFSGTNGYCITWGAAQEDSGMQTTVEVLQQREQITFWPGGGGELEDEKRPTSDGGYFIVGSWMEWQNPEPMEEESVDVWGYTVTMGINCWEQFQIWIDADPQRVLHPGQQCAPSVAPVLGPDEDMHDTGSNWLIEGSGASSSSSAVADGGDSQELATQAREACPSLGRPGERYRVRLTIAGRWRRVDWERLEAPPIEEIPLGRYYLIANWNDWTLEEMQPDPAEQGCFRAEICLTRKDGSFQLIRNRDYFQVFHPTEFSQDSDDVQGPDEGGYGLDWFLSGQIGERFVIEFQRSWVDGAEVRKLRWRRLAGDAG